jgi:hypothetical protein
LARRQDAARPVPKLQWRSYGTNPLPSGAKALDEPFNAFLSWGGYTPRSHGFAVPLRFLAKGTRCSIASTPAQPRAAAVAPDARGASDADVDVIPS